MGLIVSECDNGVYQQIYDAREIVGMICTIFRLQLSHCMPKIRSWLAANKPGRYCVTEWVAPGAINDFRVFLDFETQEDRVEWVMQWM